MRKLVVFGVPVKVHPALPLTLALALWLDAKTYVFMACAFLLLHEVMHVVVARRMNLRVVEMELMPLGGAARIEGIWLLRPSQIAKVSLAGPLTNLGLVILFAALGWFFGLGEGAVLDAIRINALLFAFNMLPALPLDGGRVLCGWIANRAGPERAVRIGVRLGMALGAVFLSAAALLFFLYGKLHLTMIVCAAYLIACGPQEINDAHGASLMSMIDREGELEREGALPIFWIAVEADEPAAGVVRKIRPGRLCRFAVYRNMEFVAVVEEKAFREALMKDGRLTFDEIIHWPGVHATKTAPIRHLQ